MYMQVALVIERYERSHKTVDEICKVEKYKLARGVARRVCSPKRTDLSSRFL